MNLKQRFYYNFRVVPEAVWLITITILGTFLIDIIGRFLGVDEWPSLDTWQAWASAAAFGAVRAGLGIALAKLTGGGFQLPGQPATNQPPAS